MITSVGNTRVKRIVQLNQKARARREENVFVAEGMKMFLEAPEERIRDIFVTESFLDKCGSACRKRLEHHIYETVTDEVFRRIADTQNPQGILCTVEQFAYQLDDILLSPRPLVILLEDLQDPGNLGTIVRTGEGAGINAVVMSSETADIYNPKTIRATMGSIYRMPFIYTDSLRDVMLRLRAGGVSIYAAHLEGSRSFYSCSYKEGTAFLIGNEGNGLKKETADAADAYIRIPMAGQVESLNAAVSASLLMYEAKRQRDVDLA